MNYTKKDLGSYNLHLIKTDKFKTITVRVMFHTPIKKNEITKRNILTDILLLSSKKYKSRRDLTIKSEELYASDIVSNNYRLGNYIFTNFSLRTLSDKYTEKGNLEKAIQFLSEIIFNPDVTSKEFQESKIDIVKNNASLALDSIKENASSYCLMRMYEAYNNKSPISYRMVGYQEDLDKVDTKSLYETYENMIDKDYIDVFVVGNYDEKEMTSLIKKYFKFRKVKKKKEGYSLPLKKARTRRLIAKETIDNKQSKLGIICQLGKLTDYEKKYVLALGNIIFGNGSDSKLFKEVREKNSLCYTINSFTHKLDNVLIITAGIDKVNYKKTLDLITKNLKHMQKGNFTDQELSIAKEFYNTAADETYETENRTINEFLAREIMNLEPVEERVKIIEKVTKQEIVKVFKKIRIDTVFLLEGVKNGED